MEHIAPTYSEARIISTALQIKSKFKVDTRSFRGDNTITLGNKIGRKLGGYSIHYRDGYTLKQFFTSILNASNYKNKSTVDNLFKKVYTEARKLFKDEGINIPIDRIKALVDHYTIYKKWIGFRFEYNIKVYLEYNRFTVMRTLEYIDEEYKLDIVVLTSKGKKIGIQCKAATFINSNNLTYLESNVKGQKKAIRERIVEEVYYILHNKKGEIQGVRDCTEFRRKMRVLISLEKLLSNKIEKDDVDTKKIFKEELIELN